MTLRLADEPLTLPALCRNLNHLVIDHAVRQGHCGEERQQVGAHRIAVDSLRLDGMNQCRQVYGVDIHERKALDGTVADFQILVRAFEVRHAERPLAEVKGHKAV